MIDSLASQGTEFVDIASSTLRRASKACNENQRSLVTSRTQILLCLLVSLAKRKAQCSNHRRRCSRCGQASTATKREYDSLVFRVEANAFISLSWHRRYAGVYDGCRDRDIPGQGTRQPQYIWYSILFAQLRCLP